MTRSRRLSAGAIRALAIATALAFVGMVMIVIGWPEEHPWQSSLLQISWLMFDVGIFIVLWHLIQSRQLLPPRSERFRMCWFMLLGGASLGLLLYLIALVSGQPMLTPLGQLCIAIGLGAMSCYLAATGMQRTRIANVAALPDLDRMMHEVDADIDDAPQPELATPRRAALD